MEMLNGELSEAYAKIKFLKLEVVQANAKVDRVSSKKLDEVLAHQKPFFDKSGLGYTGESSSSVKMTKDMKFMKAKELMVATTNADKVNPGKKKNVTDQRFMTNLLNNQWSNLRVMGNLSQIHKEVQEHNTSAITVDFKDTLDQIVRSLEH